MKMSRVFISHSSHDKEFAHLVVAALRTPELAPWIDSEQIVAGDDIFDRLGHGLQYMDVLVFFISRASLDSEWVALEIKYAIRREIDEKRVMVLPFIVDDTLISALPWFLTHRNVVRVTPDTAGAATVVNTVRKSLARRSDSQPGAVSGTEFRGDSRIDRLLKNVELGDWKSADDVAIEVLQATDEFGQNELFTALLKYRDYGEEGDVVHRAFMIVESCVQLAPWLVDHELLARLASHRNSTVRTGVASICMDLAQHTPDRVPTDILLTLSKHDEDWYTQAHATAALKALAHLRPAILRIFFERLRSPDPDARAHAAAALADIAKHEPEILDAEELERELNRLEQIGDKEALYHIALALPNVRQAKPGFRFRYGI